MSNAMNLAEALFLAGLPTGDKGELKPGHTTWDMLGAGTKERYRRMATAVLRDAADDPEFLRAAHLAIEDVLVEWRDARLSTPFCGNGLVVRERDGKASSQIRMSTREALTIGLKAMADHLEKPCE